MADVHIASTCTRTRTRNHEQFSERIVDSVDNNMARFQTRSTLEMQPGNLQTQTILLTKIKTSLHVILI